MRILTVLGLLAVLGFAGCSTVETRIKEKPEVYGSLPEKQKTLINQEQVIEGMSPDAAYLAWGKPDTVIRGSDRGHATEEWVYEANRSATLAAYRSSPIIYGRRGRFYGGWDFIFDPVVVSQPYPYKSIRFEDGRAVAWRSIPPR